MPKNYILDTNVLIHDPECIFKFEEHNVIIPMTVIEELDDLKERRNTVSADARRASNNIRKALTEDKIAIEVCSQMQTDSRLTKPINDNYILRTALFIYRTRKEPSVLITKDTNVWIKAEALGIEAEDYKHDVVDSHVQGTCAITDFMAHCEYGFDQATNATYLPLDSLKKSFPHLAMEKIRYVCESGKIHRAYVAGERFYIESMIELGPVYKDIKPKNMEQKLAMTVLGDNTSFVCLEGPAGSGKTFLALHYAVQSVMEDKKYKSIVILRSSDSNHIGHLPGTEEEKMLPWMQGFIDNLELLYGDDKGQVDYVIQKANIKFRSLDLVRGRSYQDTIVIVDEAQNNTRHQLKAILTRMGEGSKLIMLGNLAQIDTPYLNERTSGLTHVCANMAGFEEGAICVFKDVHRSPLTKYAEENL